jgi:PAS domain S-box-containing protein
MGDQDLNSDFYTRVVSGTPAMICLVSTDGTAIFVNPACERITGYPASELVGKNFWHILYPGDDYKQVEGVMRIFNQVDVLDHEMTLTTKEGAKRAIAWNLIGRSPAGPGQILAFGIDVTKRNEAMAEGERLLHDLERRTRQLQLAAEVSKSLSTILNTEKLINQTVEQVKEYFGYYYVGLFLVDKNRECAILRAGTGKAGQQMLAAGHKLAIGEGSMIGWSIAHVKPRIALDVGQDAVHFNNPALPETRSEVALPLISRGHCLGALTFQSKFEADFSDEDVAILSVMAEQLAVVIENTRLYQEVQSYAADLEKRVAERTAELTLVNKELEAFAYSVSHDLRAPLRAIDGFSQALLEDYSGKLDETGEDYLRRVQTASRRMAQLISDLLKLSRLIREEMIREQVDLSTVASEVIADLQEAHPDRQVEVVIQPGLTVNGDSHLLRVTLENLLGNAWKFTSKQPNARIEFGCKEIDGLPTYFVRDNGAGFDMTYAHKLFGAFQRLHAVTEFDGTGIGLATVQRIIHRHGGRIWAKSQVGQGATFYFTL